MADVAASPQKRSRDEDLYNPQTKADAGDKITTLHIGNLPSDATERELRNLVALLDGFEGSILRVKAKPLAFVKFKTREQATSAMKKLSNFAFDPYYPDTHLRVEFARREMNVEQTKRPRIDKYQPRPSDHREYQPYYDAAPAPRPSYSRAPPVYQHPRDAAPPSAHYYSPAPAARAAPRSRSGGPCDTLCVMGLVDVEEQQVRDLDRVFKSQAGYVAQKVPANGRPFGFVKFESVDFATDALQALRQSNLTSWKTGLPLVIEYAKRSYNP